LAAALSAGLATLLVLALAACSGEEPAEATRASATAERSVVDAEGTQMQVPDQPQRVVALSEPTLDGALALGVTPIGTITGRGQSTVPHYLADLAGDIPVLGGVAQPDYEAIAAAEPDLILVDGTSINNNPDALSILRNIAPTFFAGYAGGDWRANLGQVAAALGREAEADDVLSAYDDQVSQARQELTSYRGETFSIVRWQGGSASLILTELPAGMALTDLGLDRPPSQSHPGRGHSEPVSLENLAQIDADYMFFGTLGGSSVGNTDAGGDSDVAAAEQALEAAERVPGFTGLHAYREGHIIPVDGSLWTSTGGPLLMSRIVTSVMEALS